MTIAQTEFTAGDAVIPVGSQEPSLTVGPSALDRLLARGRIRGALAMLGPAFVAVGGVRRSRGTSPLTSRAGRSSATCCCGWSLAANLMAMLVQYLSAKLGIVHRPRAAGTGPRPTSAPEPPGACGCRSEVVAMATDVAEFIGAALGLNLLFGVPMLAGRADHRP